MSLAFLLCLIATCVFGYDYYKDRSRVSLGLAIFALSFCVSGLVALVR